MAKTRNQKLTEDAKMKSGVIAENKLKQLSINDAATKTAAHEKADTQIMRVLKSLGLVKAEVVEGKDVVQTVDKAGKRDFIKIIKEKGKEFVKVAGIVIGLNLFMSCMTTGRMAYNTPADSQGYFGNNGRPTAQEEMAARSMSDYNNVWETGVSDMAAHDPSFIGKLEVGGMSYDDATRWAENGGIYTNEIIEKLRGKGLGRNAYTVVENDILSDMRAINARARRAMLMIDDDLMSPEELNPMIAQRQTDNPDFQRNATLITFKEWFAAVDMSPQPKQAGQDRVGYNRATNEFVKAKDAYMERTNLPDNAVNRLAFYTTEMVSILRGKYEGLAKQNQQFEPMLRTFNANVAKLNAFAANPLDEQLRINAEVACAKLTQTLADDLGGINTHHLRSFWEEYTLITTMLGNIRALERNPQLKGVSQILNAHEPQPITSSHESEPSPTSPGNGGNNGGGGTQDPGGNNNNNASQDHGASGPTNW